MDMKPTPTQQKKALLFILIILFALLTGCRNKPADAEANAPPPPAVTVSRPVTRDVIHYAEFSGTTEAVEAVTIRARVEGYLDKIHFTEGAMVTKGMLLFTIDDRPYQARLDEAKAELALRQAEFVQARATKTRKENALRDGAVSEVDVIDARAQMDKSEAGMAAAKAAIRAARLDLSYTRVEAPISGRIGRSMVDAGNLVGAEERTQLTTIVRYDPIYAYFTISERDWIRYRAGRDRDGAGGDPPKTVLLGLAGDKDYPYTGELDFIDNHVDAATGTIQVRGIFSNPNRRILPGLFARVRIPVGATDKALLVPESALGRDQQGRFLLLANQSDVAEYRPVKAGELVDDLRVIESGLNGDERIIVNGLQKARPGAAVMPQEETKGPAGASPHSRRTDKASPEPPV
jgi:RND family efflux transporter MFP subunit